MCSGSPSQKISMNSDPCTIWDFGEVFPVVTPLTQHRFDTFWINFDDKSDFKKYWTQAPFNVFQYFY